MLLTILPVGLVLCMIIGVEGNKEGWFKRFLDNWERKILLYVFPCIMISLPVIVYYVRFN